MRLNTRFIVQDQTRRRVRLAAAMLAEFARDDRGQDVIEYGLLSAFFGIVTIAVWVTIQANLHDAYAWYDSHTQSIWQSPDPGGS